MRHPHRSLSPLVFAALAVIVFSGTLLSYHAANAQLPVARLYSVFPPGGKLGATLDVTVGGEDLEDAKELHFSAPGIKAVQKTQPPALGQEGPQPVPGQFTVSIAPEVQPGLYEVRAYGKYGVSNPRSFVVGTAAEVEEKEPNNDLEHAEQVTLGSIINGRSNGGSDLDYYQVALKAGQRLIVDCWAYRIDSRMDPSLVLFDSNGKELDRSRDANRRDPMLDFTAPADGNYFVEVHDFLYAGGTEHFYRLGIGVDAYLDFVYPPAGVPGSNDTYTLYGRNLPGGQPTDLVTADGKPLEQLQVQITVPSGESALQLDNQSLIEPEESAIDGFAYQLNTPRGPTNSVLVGIATAPVTLEQEPNDAPAQAQSVNVPCEIVGKFHPRTDADWITFEAKAGQVLWMEVFSQRLGLPTDPALLIQQVTKNDKGEEQIKEIASVDDYLNNPQGQTRRGMAIYEMKTDDPAYRFVAPGDGTYRVQVRNMANYTTEDPGRIYRLAIRPEQPDFRLIAKPRLLPFDANAATNPPTVWNPLLRKGGTELFDVVLFRRDGFNGPVEVSIEGLPAGVSSAPITLAPGEEVGELVISAAEDAAAGMALVNVVGRAKIGDQQISRAARNASMVWGGRVNIETPRSRLARNLAVAVTDKETAPFQLDLGANPTVEMCSAGNVEVPVKLIRRGDFKGAVTITPFPLPPGVKPATLTLDDKTSEGKLEFTLGPKTPATTFSFTLSATSPVSYARNPEAVTETQARKTAVDKIVGELAAAAKTATEAKAAAEKQAADMAAAMQQAKVAADTAQKELAVAQAKAQAAAEAMAAAEAQMKATAEAKAAADKAAADAEAQSKQAAEVQKAVDAELAAATKAAAPKNVNVTLPSSSVTLNVTASPLKLEATAPAASKPGTTVEIPIKLTRLYGFAEAVPVSVKPIGNAAGLKITDVSIPADQTEGKLTVEIAPDAKPGTYRLDVQAAAKFAGQDMPTKQEVSVVVEAAATE